MHFFLPSSLSHHSYSPDFRRNLNLNFHVLQQKAQDPEGTPSSGSCTRLTRDRWRTYSRMAASSSASKASSLVSACCRRAASAASGSSRSCRAFKDRISSNAAKMSISLFESSVLFSSACNHQPETVQHFKALSDRESQCVLIIRKDNAGMEATD